MHIASCRSRRLDGRHFCELGFQAFHFVMNQKTIAVKYNLRVYSRIEDVNVLSN